MTERQRTALHEAGHAVVARALGRSLDSVTLDELVAGRGGATYFDPRWRASLERISGELSITLAGRIAEAIADGEDWRILPLPAVFGLERISGACNSREDFVADVAALLRPDVDHDAAAQLHAGYWFERALTPAAAEAARILRRDWAEVTALAARLDRSGRVQFVAA